MVLLVRSGLVVEFKNIKNGNTNNLGNFSTGGNPTTCIQVDDVVFVNITKPKWSKEATATYSENCL